MGKQYARYQTISGATGTGAGYGQLTAVANGRIVGITARYRQTGGAGIGFYTATLCVNNTAQATGETSGAPRLVDVCNVTWGVASGAASSQTWPWIPANYSIRAGDVISIGLVQTGTAAASGLIAFDVFVDEG